MRTYGAIEWSGGGWVITDLEPHVRLKLKAIFPRVPKKAAPPYVLTGTTQLDADLAWFMTRYPLAIAEADQARMMERRSLFELGQQELATLLSPSWKPTAITGFRDGERPYDYQMQAAILARRKGRLLLMDDLGLGKTVSAIATFCEAEYLPALIVPQTHLVTQWEEKVAEFTHLKTHILTGTIPYALPDVEVYLCPYSRLGAWTDFAETARFRTIVFDEVQELRNGTSTSKGAAAKRFRDQASIALGLSATPIFNYGAEIFQIVDILERGALGSFDDFTTEWCFMGSNGKWMVKDPPALGTFLREQHFSLRRTSADVGHEKQPVNVITHETAYDAEVIEDDAALMRDLAVKVTTGSFVEKGQAAREFDMRMRHATGLAKAFHVAAFVRILLEAGQPVVLFGWHRDVYDIWLERLKEFNPKLYTGSESTKQKDAAKKAFCSGETNLLILSLRSGAGLDGLQARSHTAVFGELDWSPKVHEQCLSTDTEILTPKGFKTCNEVSVGDAMYAFDLCSGEIREVRVDKKIERAVGQEESIYETNTDGISLRVTGEHRMVVRRKLRRTRGGVSRGAWGFVVARDLAGKSRRFVPVNGGEKSNGVPLTDAEIRLIGWFISDGSITSNGRALNFYQRADKPWNVDLTRTLTECGLRWGCCIRKQQAKRGEVCVYYVAKSNDYRWRTDELELLESAIGSGSHKDVTIGGRSPVAVQKMAKKVLRGERLIQPTKGAGRGWGHLAKYFDKDLCRNLEAMTEHQLWQLLHGLHMGDGRKAVKDIYRITSINKTLFDRIQSLCVRRGIGAKITQRKSKTTSGNHVYDLHVSRKTEAAIPFGKDNALKQVPAAPDERVWCVSNELQTIVVRRRGKVSVVGNCIGRLDRPGQTQQVDAIYLIADGGSDPAVLGVLGLKASQSHGIVDPLSAPKEQHSDASRIKALAEAYLNRAIEAPAPCRPAQHVVVLPPVDMEYGDLLDRMSERGAA